MSAVSRSLPSCKASVGPTRAGSSSGRLPWHREEWHKELLNFANAASVELQVTRDHQGSTSNGQQSQSQWLSCRAGEIVVGTSRGIPAADAVWCVAYKDGVKMEGSLPRSYCQPCATYEFLVQMTVVDLPLGLKGSIQTHHGIIVEGVRSGGLIEKWNNGCARSFSRDILRAGDEIVSANGSQHPPKMLQLIQNADSVQLCVVRRSHAGLAS